MILPNNDGEARVWDSKFLGNIYDQTTVEKPKYGETRVIIAVEKAPVFKKTEYKTENVIGYLSYGTPLVVLDTVNLTGWHVIVLGKTFLYVSKNHTTTYKTIEPRVITVKAKKGYLFNIPSEKGEFIGFSVKNTCLIAIGENNNFWFVQYSGGKFGFISKTVAN
ncbi:hypothetical protein [Parageobacillus toebii]|uniref:hypothetical protein n=1 Tax=Parageobacillus toebii TaxID=153151 RepID=UPI002816552E|nr:hypothetical protein [Parageobacillus toebii]WMT19840.1 hypothetical protein RFB12_04415 [Parageobacillus toebii]